MNNDGKKNKLKVLEVHSLLIYAGGQRNILTFEKYFCKDVFDVHVMGYLAGGNLELELKKRKIPYFVGNNNMEHIMCILEKEQYDVIHIHRSGKHVQLETDLLLAAKKINSNVVIIEKNVFGGYDPTTVGLIDCHFFQSMMHLNERFLPVAKLPFDFDTMKVLYNMVDGEEFETYQVSPVEITQFRKSLNLSDNDFVLGKIGRVAIEKWSDLVIDMAPHLVKRIPNAKVVLVGVPQSRKKRIARSKYANVFRCVDPFLTQKEVHLFYQSINVLTHSSKIGECNGNTINEAFFWKKPVIINSTPRKDNGQLEQVIHGENGFVANDPISMAKAVYTLYNNTTLRAKMGEIGHQQVQTVNDPRNVTDQVEKFIVEKLQQKGVALGIFPNEYERIQYHPTKGEIIAYRKEYQRRLDLRMKELNTAEQIQHTLLFSKRCYWKIRDFLEHKYAVYHK